MSVYEVKGSDGRTVGVYEASELQAFKAAIIKNVDDGVCEVEVFTITEVERDPFTHGGAPAGGRGRKAGAAAKRWSAPHGLAGHDVSTQPKAAA